MECINCGADVSIHEPECPYCGTENPEAVAYQKEKEAQELEAKKADAEVKKARIKADLKDSVEGASRAKRVLNVLIALCSATIVIGLALGLYFEQASDTFTSDSVAPQEGSYAEKMLTEMESYEDIYEFRRLIECMDDFMAEVNKKQVPDEAAFREVARCLNSAWRQLGYSWNQEDHPQTCEDLEVYVCNVLSTQFNLTPDETWFLSVDTYLSTEEATRAGRELRAAYLEVH